MKHVFIETNFLVEVLRPLPQREALKLLLRRKNGELTLWAPWCSIAEARRTLERVINEDLGFHERMQRFAGQQMKSNRDANRPDLFDNREIRKLKTLVEKAIDEALKTKNDRIVALSSQLEVILPSERVIQKTLELFDTKSLKPFDEMALGAVLSCAEKLFAEGERDLHFCTLDKKDLAPSERPNLQMAYAQCGLAFHHDFIV